VSLPKIRLEQCVRTDDGLWRLDERQARHLVRSLRSYSGASVEGLLPQEGGVRMLMKLDIRGGGFFLRPADEGGPEAEDADSLSINLLVGLLKSDQFDAVLRASSELGVGVICPVLCERSVPRISADDIDRKAARWQRVLDEGSKVSGSVFPPKVLPPVRFDDVKWEDMPDERYAAVITSGASRISGARPKSGSIVYAVGPEGDWSDDETALLLEKNFKPVSLGRRIMRASTAVIVGCGWFRLNAE
jgi:16S rRNA (uracil1498-N3)-methyltransferase